MLPGYVSGFYIYEDCHINLERLSLYAGAKLVQQEATGIDIQVCTGRNHHHDARSHTNVDKVSSAAFSSLMHAVTAHD